MVAGIFHFRNIATGDGYVSDSCDIETRVSRIIDLLRQGRWVARSKSPQAVLDWKIYGEKCFEVVILEIRHGDWTPEWEFKRRYWQAKVNSVYNVNLDVDVESSRGAGVYMITNLYTGDRYIGSTDCFGTRKFTHISNLRSGKAIKKMQDSFAGLDMSYFNFEILERCDASNLEIRETFWIAKLNPELNTRKKAVVHYSRKFPVGNASK